MCCTWPSCTRSATSLPLTPCNVTAALGLGSLPSSSCHSSLAIEVLLPQSRVDIPQRARAPDRSVVVHKALYVHGNQRELQSCNFSLTAPGCMACVGLDIRHTRHTRAFVWCFLQQRSRAGQLSARHTWLGDTLAISMLAILSKKTPGVLHDAATSSCMHQ